MACVMLAVQMLLLVVHLQTVVQLQTQLMMVILVVLHILRCFELTILIVQLEDLVLLNIVGDPGAGWSPIVVPVGLP